MPTERLQKVLARAGIASRRAAEELIAEGRVRVNGRIVREMGVQVDSYREKVEVDGRRVVGQKPVYYVLNKPRKMVSTLSDPEGRDTIKNVVARIPERVYPIGRLDYHTSGVLLVTNDGQMTEALLRPKRAVPKIYIAKVQGFLEIEELDQLRKGVPLDDGYRTKPAELFVVREEASCTWVQITLTEGKNRQVHRMFEAIQHRVMRLSRVSFADITLDGLRPGQLRPLRDREIDKLKKRYLNPAKLEANAGHRRGGVRAGDREAIIEELDEVFDDELDGDEPELIEAHPHRPRGAGGPARRKPAKASPRSPKAKLASDESGAEPRPSRGRPGSRKSAQGESSGESRPSRGRPGSRKSATGESGAEPRPSRGRPGGRKPAQGESGAEPRPSRGRPGGRKSAEGESSAESRPSRGRPGGRTSARGESSAGPREGGAPRKGGPRKGGARAGGGTRKPKR